MGAFYDELKTAKRENDPLARLRKALNDEDFKDVVKALKDPSISARAIHTALVKRDIHVAGLTAILNARKALNETIG